MQFALQSTAGLAGAQAPPTLDRSKPPYKFVTLEAYKEKLEVQDELNKPLLIYLSRSATHVFQFIIKIEQLSTSIGLQRL